MQDLIKRLLIELGEDPAREGLVRTPKRVDKALRFLTSGYSANVDEVLNGALFGVDYNEMVIVRDIDFYSLCEHHLLPFHGVAHIGYVPGPDGRITGLSKLARLVDAYPEPQAEQLLDRSVPVVTYCWGPGCNGATRAALALAELGYQVKEMLGGFEYWARAGFAYETWEGRERRAADPLTAPVDAENCGC